MGKNPATGRSVDSSRVNLNDRQAIKYWTQKWAVTESQLRRAVRKVGDNPRSGRP